MTSQLLHYIILHYVLIYFVILRYTYYKREELETAWKILHYEVLHNLYATLNITGLIKLWRMR